jgi:long-chain acyl-CoA synthetase
VLHPGLRFVFTAAAPLSAQAYGFFEKAGVPVHEGWGLTETSPCATLTPANGPRSPGVAGWPLPGTEVLLAPTEAATTSSAGEVLVRGPQVMRGYHRAPEETRRALTDDGFLRSGDIGEWTDSGLRVRGRVDDVFKLENGEKVPAAIVEARVLASSPLLEQAVVLGPGQPHVTALCWISVAAARAWAEAQGLEAGSLGDLIRMPDLRRAITEALQAANLLAPVPYERVRRVALVPAALSLETGELTPTQKVVRSAVLRRNAELVAALAAGAPHELILEIRRDADAF